MAILFELDKERWDEWLSERPQEIKEMAATWPPNKLYRLKTTQQRCTLYSYSEDGTVTVNITGDHNLIPFSRQVFGINPNDLEECELPGKDEPVGEMFTEDQSMEWINARRKENGLCPIEEDPEYADND